MTSTTAVLPGDERGYKLRVTSCKLQVAGLGVIGDARRSRFANRICSA
jgi:hypothetical protein